MARKRISRRKFVGDVGAGVAFAIVPRHVLGRGPRAPSDTVNVACIGVGGLGADDLKGVAKAGANIYALFDVDEHQGASSFTAFPKAKRFKDFRVMLDKEGKNIDAVTVSTPDHTHTVAGMMALKMGKHTRIQKPLARTLWEVRQLVETARKTKVATQMGNQGHAGEGTRQIREWVEAGAIGTVREIQLWTNRPIWPQALERPLEEYYTPPWIDWDLWLGPGGVAVRYERPVVDRSPGQPRGGNLRRGAATAGRGPSGRAPRPPAGAEVPAPRERLRRVDRGVQGRHARGLELPRPCGSAHRDGPAGQSGGAHRPSPRDRLAHRRSRQHQDPGGVRALAVSLRV